MRGCIHVYCGDGKGKTTAAVGLCVRAAGCGKKVLFAQFLKDDSSSERSMLALLPGVRVFPAPKTVKFTFLMTEEEKAREAERCEEQLRELCREAPEYDLLVLDEALGAVGCGLLREEELLRLMKEKPEPLELVLTGRNPGASVLALADYVSEVRKLKHPYDCGLAARKGIEY